MAIFKTNKLKKCKCGHTPKEYNVHYGSTPYDVVCKCGKQSAMTKCLITGSNLNLIDYWNKYVRLHNKKTLESDKKIWQKKRNLMTLDKKSNLYWEKKIGEVIY